MIDERRLGAANLAGWGTSFSRILKREPEGGADDVVRVVLAAEVHIVEHRGARENFFQKKSAFSVNVLPAVLGCPPK
jgi:hypothetical protein